MDGQTGEMNFMARKPGSKSEFVLFDVLYEDGERRSHRKVPREALQGMDGDDPARAILEAQDREIAQRSGRILGRIKSVKRSA